MMEYINFFISTFVIDFILCIIMKKYFKLTIKNYEVFFLQFINVSVSVIFVFCKLQVYHFILMKLLSNFLISILITDSYKFSDIFLIYISSIILMFSLLGCFVFLIAYFKVVSISIFNLKIANQYSFLLILGIILYFLTIIAFFKKMSKYKTLEKFLKKVSFYINNQHIELKGLLDSGNSLRDKKTNKPVIVISIHALKKYFKNLTYEQILDSGLCNRSIKCVVAGGLKFDMPIIDIKSVKIYNSEGYKNFDSVLGVVNQSFYDDKKYDCLLSRDFF